MSLQQARERLAALEGPRQRFHHARHKHATLAEELARAPEKFAAHPKLIAAVHEAHDEAERLHHEARAAHDAHTNAFKEKGVDLDREIDKAAQAVLDVRAATDKGE